MIYAGICREGGGIVIESEVGLSCKGDYFIVPWSRLEFWTPGPDQVSVREGKFPGYTSGEFGLVVAYTQYPLM